MANEFSVDRFLGKGGFGKVYLVTHQVSQKQYALKKVSFIDQTPQLVMLIQQEVDLLKTLKHVYILRFLKASIQGSYMCIYTEYCPNGDIGRYIEMNKGTAMDVRKLLLWIRQITKALQYLHQHNPKIIHRDLKPDNIFLDENWNTKLGDFGIARILKTQTSIAGTQIGTPDYMSPERVTGIPYTEKADIYSLGIMMYEMCYMNKHSTLPQLISFKNLNQTLPPLPPGYNGGIKELLTLMMSYNPNNRPSATQILFQIRLFKTTKASPCRRLRPLTGSHPPRSLTRAIGSSDRRCVQRAETESPPCQLPQTPQFIQQSLQTQQFIQQLQQQQFIQQLLQTQQFIQQLLQMQQFYLHLLLTPQFYQQLLQTQQCIQQLLQTPQSIQQLLQTQLFIQQILQTSQFIQQLPQTQQFIQQLRQSEKSIQQLVQTQQFIQQLLQTQQCIQQLPQTPQCNQQLVQMQQCIQQLLQTQQCIQKLLQTPQPIQQLPQMQQFIQQLLYLTMSLPV